MSLHDAPDEGLHDDELRRRYQALPPDLPSADTDAAILAAARRAVGAGPRRIRTGLWTGGLATAATVTLMVALLLPSWRSGELAEQVAVAPPAAPTLPAPAAPDRAPEAAAPAVAEAAPAKPAPDRMALPPRPPAAAPVAAAPPLPLPVAAEVSAPDEGVERSAAMAAQEAAQVAREAAARQREAATVARDEAARAAEKARPRLMAPPPPTGAVAQSPARADSGEAATFMGAPKSIVLPAPAPAATAEAPVAPAPAEALAADDAARRMPAAATSFSYDGALLQGLYRPALGWLTTGPEADRPGREAERDLLRQLLASGEALRCRGDGPPSAQRLCLLLQRHAAGRPVSGDDLAALAEALRHEGREPLPLLQALRRLLDGPPP